MGSVCDAYVRVGRDVVDDSVEVVDVDARDLHPTHLKICLRKQANVRLAGAVVKRRRRAARPARTRGEMYEGRARCLVKQVGWSSGQGRST